MTKRSSGVSSGILVHQAAEASYCVETRENIGVIYLYRGAIGSGFPCSRVILTLPHRHPHGAALTHGSSPYYFDPKIKLVDRAKNSLTEFDEACSSPPGPERHQVPEAPLRYSAGVQLRYRRKILFRWLWSAKPLRSAISLSARLSRRRCRHACSTFCF